MGNATIFSVPLEIRNQIYCYVYACDIVYPMTKPNGLRCLYMDIHKAFPGSSLQKELFPSPSASKVLALLLVNHQILEEAAAIFYRRNQFQGNALEMSRFIKGIGRVRANLLTNLVLLHTELALENDLLKCLLPLEGLKMVHLNSWNKNFDGLKDSLVRAGILDLTGKFNIEVLNVSFKHREAGDGVRYQEISHVWSCEKGDTEWKGPKKTVTCIRY